MPVGGLRWPSGGEKITPGLSLINHSLNLTITVTILCLFLNVLIIIKIWTHHLPEDS